MRPLWGVLFALGACSKSHLLVRDGFGDDGSGEPSDSSSEPSADGGGDDGACEEEPERECSTRACGELRDHNCDGTIDERQLCRSVCGTGGNVYFPTQTFFPSDEVTRIGGVRGDEESEQFIVGTTEGVRVHDTLGVVSSVDMPEVTALSVADDLIAVGTTGGLALLTIDESGSLSLEWGVVPLFPADPGITAVRIVPGTPERPRLLYVSDRDGVSVYEVSDPTCPEWLDDRRGEAAFALAPVAGGVMGLAGFDFGNLVFFETDTDGSFTFSFNVSQTFGVDGEIVTALETYRREVDDDGFTAQYVVLGALSTDESAATLRVYDDVALADVGLSADLLFELGGFTVIVGANMDQSVLTFVTDDGIASAYARGGPDIGVFDGTFTTTSPFSVEDMEFAREATWFGTRADGRAVVVRGTYFGFDRTVFDCNLM